MRDEASILILGSHDPHLTALAERIRALGLRAVRAKTPREALDLSEGRGMRFSVALIDAQLPTLDLARALAEIRRFAGLPGLEYIVTGQRPAPDACQRLRESGVRIAAFSPISDHALLFLLNRQLDSAGARGGHTTLRGELRAPGETTAHVFQAGRRKQAQVYSLSSGGAFLATGRPSMRGAELVLELPLASGSVDVAGKVLYTCVPGNLRRRLLPDGMGVRFHATPAAEREAIQRHVDRSTLQFQL